MKCDDVRAELIIDGCVFLIGEHKRVMSRREGRVLRGGTRWSLGRCSGDVGLGRGVPVGFFVRHFVELLPQP